MPGKNFDDSICFGELSPEVQNLKHLSFAGNDQTHDHTIVSLCEPCCCTPQRTVLNYKKYEGPVLDLQATVIYDTRFPFRGAGFIRLKSMFAARRKLCVN